MDGSTHAATWILSKQLNMINFTGDFRSKNVIGPTVSHTFPGYDIEQEIGLSVFINSTKQSVTNRGLSDLARETKTVIQIHCGGPLAGPGAQSECVALKLPPPRELELNWMMLSPS